MITYQTETVDGVLPDILPLLLDHYREVEWRQDKIPFNPDYDSYRALEKAGALEIYTARDDGALVGYAIFVVSSNLHYRVVQAQNDLFYVKPSHRGIMISQHLLRDFAESELKALGVQVINLTIKSAHNWQLLAERWGYEHTEINMQRWIGD